MIPQIRRSWPAIALLGLLAIGLAGLWAGSADPVLAIVLIIFGALLFGVGTMRIVRPDWRTTDWWRDHPAFRFAFSWKSSAAPPDPWAERLSGILQLACGALFVVAGFVALV